MAPFVAPANVASIDAQARLSTVLSGDYLHTCGHQLIVQDSGLWTESEDAVQLSVRQLHRVSANDGAAADDGLSTT